MSVEEIIEEESRPLSPIHLKGNPLYQSHLVLTPHTKKNYPSLGKPNFNSPLNLPQKMPFRSLILTNSMMVFQPMSSIC